MSAVRGDALHLPLPDKSVDLIVTSPPYFALRSYRDEGEHYAGQIGSEATPQAFLEALWTATREMVRVLKPTGSMFINLGDKFSPGQPLDDVMTVGDAGWLAGLVDADGTITVRKTQQPQMRAPSYESIIAVEQSDEGGIRRAQAITGRGNIVAMPSRKGSRPSWRWTVSTQEARWVAERIWPWLQIKRNQALAVAELARHREEHSARGRWNPILPEWTEYRDRICEAVRAWNRREVADWVPPYLPVIELPERPRFLQPKTLAGLPWRYAIGCIDDLGLILRAEIVWSKPNGLPESVTDRVRRSHEQWFHFTREPRYFSAVDEVREPPQYPDDGIRGDGGAYKWHPTLGRADHMGVHSLGKLPGSVWSISSEPLKVPAHLGIDHFAAFPQEWPRRLILGWSPSGICVECGEGRRPVVEMESEVIATSKRSRSWNLPHDNGLRKGGLAGVQRTDMRQQTTITGYACACPEPTTDTRPSVVLDPFGGTGTVALVARALGRIGTSVDLSMDYCRLAKWRIAQPASKVLSRTWHERQGAFL